MCMCVCLSLPCVHALLKFLQDVLTEGVDGADVEEDLLYGSVRDALLGLLVERHHHLTEVHRHYLDATRVATPNMEDRTITRS